MGIKQAIYEHLKTRRKYNTLKLKYDCKCEDYDSKTVELNTVNRIRKKEKDVWEARIVELTEENIKLKEENAQLKKEYRQLKKDKK